MNPMSLVTLPADVLRDAYARAETQGPEAERAERQFALAVCLVAVAASVGMFLAG